MDGVRYVITKYHNGVLSFTHDNKTNKMESVNFTQSVPAGNMHGECTQIGDIFVAKVISVARQINAAFIYYAPDKKGYLPINPAYVPVLVNRRYDGRILAGDEILVQFEKEAVRTKEPVFTMNLSFAGKYCVVSNANTYKGVSKKCTKSEREQLMSILPQDMEYGVVIRTNAAALLNDSLVPITDEITQLSQKMTKLLKEGIHRTCYSRIWQSPPLYLTRMRDEGVSYQQIVTDDEILYHETREFVSLYMPEQLANVSLYQDDSYPLQKLYRVETQLDELLSKKVWLKSGAYLFIEKTEAMYVVDVNSGKNISKKETSEYIYQINIEAAGELMRQIRLRNLTGMILVDFINMDDDKKDEALLQELKLLAKKDPIQTTVLDITALGLVEITRKKTTKSLSGSLAEIKL